MSSLIGKLNDRANIVMSGFSEFEKAVIKATRHNTKPPKEKHVRRLIVYTSERSSRSAELINLLAKRLELADWLVVMKTLIVFHRLLRDGNPNFISELRYRSAIFNLRKFADMSSPEAHHQSIFIRKYSQYLEEKVLVFKIIGVEYDKDPAITKGYTLDEAFERIPRLQSQVNALLNTRGSKDHLNNAIILTAFGLLLKDSFKLYRALNDGIIVILEHYFSMPKPTAIKALDIYKLFAKETDGIIQFFDIAKRFAKGELPTLQHAPTTLVEALENYVKDLDEGRNPNPPSHAADKKNMVNHTQSIIRNTQKQMDAFRFDDFDEIGGEDSDSDNEEEYKPKAPASSSSHHSNNNHTNNSAPNLIDPFGDIPSQTTTASTNSHNAGSVNLFDDFGSDPFGNSSSSSFDSNKGQQQPTFDPFGLGNDPSISPRNNPAAYNNKKNQIEAVMSSALGQTPLSPVPFASPVVNSPPPTGFPTNATASPNPFAPAPSFGASPNFAAFPPMNNAAPTFNPMGTAPAPFAANFPPANNASPFGAAPQANTQQPAFNPFMQPTPQQKGNPFG